MLHFDGIFFYFYCNFLQFKSIKTVTTFLLCGAFRPP